MCSRRSIVIASHRDVKLFFGGFVLTCECVRVCRCVSILDTGIDLFFLIILLLSYVLPHTVVVVAAAVFHSALLTAGFGAIFQLCYISEN